MRDPNSIDAANGGKWGRYLKFLARPVPSPLVVGANGRRSVTGETQGTEGREGARKYGEIPISREHNGVDGGAPAVASVRFRL